MVDDYEPWRHFLCSTLLKQPDFEVVAEVSNGLEAVQKAEELRPHLILLDVGLSELNGIDAALRIRRLSPHSTMLFVSLQASADVVRAALGTGAKGYIFKTDARRELLTAVNTVLRGDQYVSSRFSGPNFTEASDVQDSKTVYPNRVSMLPSVHKMEISHRHDVNFYADHAGLLDSFTQFSEAALKAGRAVIVIATESNRDSLAIKLQACGLDIGAAIEQGRYTALDAADTLSAFMVNGQPDQARFLKVVGDLMETVASAAKAERHRVAACGECAPLLWAQGKVEAAIRLEQLWNEIAKIYDVDIVCGYPLASFQGIVGSQIFQRICAEHSALRFR